jgi:hypothetical protein
MQGPQTGLPELPDCQALSGGEQTGLMVKLVPQEPLHGL